MSEFEREFQALRAEYRKRLPGLAAELVRLVEAARPGEPGEALERARGLAHRLKGTAGSYGFDAESQAFAALEDALESCAGPEPEDAWRAVDAALARLRGGAALS